MRPEVLKSSKDTETFEFILKFDTIEALRIAIANKKVSNLFYKGIAEIQTFYHDRLGITLFKDSVTKDTIEQAIKDRNNITHDRGRVDGKLIRISYINISTLHATLRQFIMALDVEIAEK